MARYVYLCGRMAVTTPIILFVLTLVLSLGCEVHVQLPARPVAVTGGDAVVVAGGGEVALDGSSSYMPGEPDAELEYRWTVVVAPAGNENDDENDGEEEFGVTLAGYDSPVAALSPEEPGLYVVRLDVSHGDRQAIPAYVNVKAHDPEASPLKPVANAGVDRHAGELEEVVLDGRGSHHPAGLEVEASWRQISGPEVDLEGAETLAPTLVTPRVFESEELVFQLTVQTRHTDETDLDTVKVIVEQTITHLEFALEPREQITAGETFGVEVRVMGADGRTAPVDDRIELSLASGPSGAMLDGNLEIEAEDGIAVFNGLGLDLAGEGYVIEATSGWLSPCSSKEFSVVHAAPSSLVMTGEPGEKVTAGEYFRITVAVEDAFGNPAPGADIDVSVRLSENPGDLGLEGTLTGEGESGVFDFDDLFLRRAGLGYVVEAFSEGVASAFSDPFDVVSGSPDSVAIIEQPPGSVAAGSPFGLMAGAVDAYGNQIEDYAHTFEVSIAESPESALLGGTLQRSAAGQGVAEFNDLWVDVAGGGYVLEVSSGSLIPAVTTQFEAEAAKGDRLVFSVHPSNVVAGEAIQPAMELFVLDVFGNFATGATGEVALSLVENPGGATVHECEATIAEGSAVLSDCWLDKAGEGYVLHASSKDLTGVDSLSFDVTPADAYALHVVTQPPDTVIAGQGFGVSGQVTDRFGNDVSEDGLEVEVSLAAWPGDVDAELEGVTVAETVDGKASFEGLRIESAGAGYRLELGSPDLAAAVTEDFEVSHSAPAELVILEQPPESVAAGEEMTVSAKLLDTYGNDVLESGVEIGAALGAAPPGAAASLGGLTKVETEQGVAVFDDLWVDVAGDGYTLLLDLENIDEVETSSFSVAHASAAVLEVRTQPPELVDAGEEISVVFHLVDSFGNDVFDDDVPVSVTLAEKPSGSDAVLHGPSEVSTVEGEAEFLGLWIQRAGEGYRISAHSSGLSSALTEQFDVGPAGPAAVAVRENPPAEVEAGEEFNVDVYLLDEYGNRSRASGVTIEASLTDEDVDLGGTTSIQTNEGEASFVDLWVGEVGTSYRVAVGSTGLEGARTSRFDVVAGDAAKLLIMLQPPHELNAGQEFDVVARLLDAYDNPVSEDGREVTIEVHEEPPGPDASLGGTVSAETSGGHVTFGGLWLDKAGPGYRLIVRSDGIESAVTRQFEVKPSAPVKLGVHLQPPGSVLAGEQFSVEIEVLDEWDNRAPVNGMEISMSVVPGTGAPGGTLAGGLERDTVDGLAVFDGLWLEKCSQAHDPYVLRASGGELDHAHTEELVVMHRAAERLAFGPPPPAEMHTNDTFSVGVRVEDSYGNLVLDNEDDISLAIHDNPGGGTLHGDLGPTPPSGGMVTFAGLRIDASGNGYILRATSGVGHADTDPFNVLHCPLNAVMHISSDRALRWDTIFTSAAETESCRPEELTFSWSLQKPEGSDGGYEPWGEFPSEATGPRPDLYVSQAGTYTLTVEVSDGFDTDSVTRSVSVAGFGQLPHHDSSPRPSTNLALSPNNGRVFIATAGHGGQSWRYIDITAGPTGWRIIPLSDCTRDQTAWVGVAGDGRVYYGYHDRGGPRHVHNVRRRVGNWRCDDERYSFTHGGVTPNSSRDAVFVGSSFYFATNQDVFFFDRSVSQFNAQYIFDDFGGGTEFTAAAMDPTGALWFGSRESGSRDGAVRTSEPPSSDHPRISFLDDDDEVRRLTPGVSYGDVNEMFVSTAGNGIFRIPDVSDPEVFEHFTSEHGLPSPLGNVARRGSLEPGTGDVWIAMEGGVARYKRDVGAFAVIPTTLQIYDVIFDSGHGRGRMVYLGTSAGVWRSRQ